MERHVKERLIGAAVLVAAAVILIPEMLSGPKRPATSSAPARAGEVPMKTYTIDLNHSPGTQAAPPTVTERAPPAETVSSDTPPPEQPATAPAVSPAPPESAAQAIVRNDAEARVPPPQTIPESATVKPVPAPVAEQPRPAPPKAKEPERPAPAAPAARNQAAPPTVTKESPKPLAPAAAAPTSKQWAVQLGSFSSKTGAERLAKEYEDRGQKAFVMPVKSGNNTLYRVRLGPFAERAAADDALRKVGNRVAGAAVVAHP